MFGWLRRPPTPHDHDPPRFLLLQLLAKVNKIMSTQAELAAALDALRAQVEKVRGEIVQKVADLEAAIANAGNSTPEVDSALESLKQAVQGVDDLVPDA